MTIKDRIKKLSFIRSAIAFNNAIASLKLGFYKIWNKKKYGYFGKDVHIMAPLWVTHYSGVFLHDHVSLYGPAKLIVSPRGGRFIMKKYSSAAMGLTVITANHQSFIPDGKFQKEGWLKSESIRIGDVVVNEDAWLAANVTLLPGANIGRGAIVGAGSVCRNNIPPYAIVMGNPAKVVGFRFKPEEIIEHEKKLYPEEERLELTLLEKNYNKYFLNRLSEIKSYLR
jgi:acetyltransferase-like isoleucine patch superfamily enzyme